MKRLLFIYPSVSNQPEIVKAISIMNGIVKKLSWEVGYFDTWQYEKSAYSDISRADSGEFKLGFSDKELKANSSLVPDLQKKIDLFKPDVIVISCDSYAYEFLLTFFPQIHRPEKVKVIVGGIHCILKPEEVIQTGFFDAVCLGEAEAVFAEILEKIENGLDFRDTKNIFFRDKFTGEITRNLRAKLIDEKKLWSFGPDYSIFGKDYFWSPFRGTMYRRFRFEVGRGCPYNCTYCANSALKSVFRGLGKYFRTRPLESVKQGLKSLVDEYDINLFLLDDECLLAHSVQCLDDLFTWYGNVIKKPLLFSTRPETITEEKIRILKKANVPLFVKMGVESGSERILKEICNRMTTIKQVFSAYEILRKYNIKSGACFMIGFPFETRDDIFKSIELARKIKPDELMVNIFQPMPGQRLREICVQAGYMKETDKPAFFTDTSILKMPQISQDEIRNLRRVFVLYATLPREYFPQIELCEKDYSGNTGLYKELIEMRWRLSNK